MSYKATSFTRILLLGATCAPLLLAACTTDNGPFPMPSGYAHHSDVYKAPDGPEMMKVNANKPAPHVMPVPVLENEEPVVQAAVVPVVAPEMLETDHWQGAADKLVKDMTVNFGKPQVPVYVVPGKSIEEMSLADALTRALLANDVNVSMERGLSPYTLSHMIVQPMDASDNRKMVKIMLNDYDKKIAEESGLFNIGANSAAVDMSSYETHEQEYEVKMERTDPEVLRQREQAKTQMEYVAPASQEEPDTAEMVTTETKPKISTPPADNGEVLARPRTTAMSKRLGGDRIESSSSAYTASAPYEDKYKTVETDAVAAEREYQSRVVSMPVMDDATEDSAYGGAMPVPLTSSTDDR